MMQSLFSKLHYIALYIFCFFPLLPNRIKGLPVVLLFLIAVFLWFKERKYSYPYKKVLFLSSLFLIYLIGLPYSENLIRIDETLSTRISLLIVPISFGLIKTTERNFGIISFSIFNKLLMLVTTVYSIWILIYLYLLGVYNDTMNLSDAIAYISNEMWIINQHPIYASIFICISILLTIISSLKEKTITTFLLVLPFLIVMALTLFILARKGIIISFSFSFIVLVLYHLKKIAFKKLTLLLLVIFIIGFLTYTPIKNRFKEVFKIETYTTINDKNSTSLRLGIYSCAIKKIMESPILGYGIGDVQLELNKCYSKRSDVLTKKTYNSHNQYLSYFLSNGIFGFLVLLIVLLKKLRDSIKQNNVFLLCMIVFFGISMLFENILERQSGVILFSFFFYLFSFYSFNNMEINEEN